MDRHIMARHKVRFSANYNGPYGFTFKANDGGVSRRMLTPIPDGSRSGYLALVTERGRDFSLRSK